MKLNYCNEFLIKKLFLFKKKIVFKKKKKLLFARSSIITKNFLGYNILIYTGKKWKSYLVNKWVFGFKFGELTWNKKKAFYKIKQLKKKKK